MTNPFIQKKEQIEEELTKRNSIPRVGAGRRSTFDELMSDDSEEEALLQAKQNNTLRHIKTYNEQHEPVLAMVEKNIKELQRMYPTGGIKASRVITTDVLLEAPPTFFEKYESTIKEGADYVRQALGESDRAEVIKKAQDNPTEDAAQDEAFYIVSSYISEFLEKSNWRDVHRKIVHSMICNEILGFGRLEPLWRDRRIDEIICNGPFDVQAEIRGILRKVPGCRFRDTEHLMSLMERLYGAIGKVVSAKTPIVAGRLHDKSRMNITHTSICPDGPNVNIRRHPEGFWTPQELINFGSAPEPMMQYLGNLIYKGVSVLVVGGTGSGKALTLDTKIHTPQGCSTMGEIQVGDEILDHHGNIGIVTNKFPQPKRQVYAVKFSNGETVYADAEHNWYVSTRKSNLDYSVKTTQEMLSEGIKINGEHNFRVPMIETPVVYDNEKAPEDLPIHPYLLGLWLGDFQKQRTNENTTNWEIVSDDFKNKLRQLGVLQESDSKGSQKHVPNIYKYASTESRKLLLAGLIDSDETINEAARWTFTNTNRHLVEDCLFVASSLGYKTSITEGVKKRFAYRGEKEISETSWNVHIATETIKNETGDFNKEISIEEITLVEGRFEEMACITVDTPDSTYMVGHGFITTHNTSLLNSLTGFYRDNARLVTLEDNLEMKPNPKKFLSAPLETRASSSDNDNSVTMRDLVHTALRMRPEAILVGEVRDDAAYDLAQALNTGHYGASTIHANTAQDAIPRVSSLISQSGLTTVQGALDMIAAAFDIVVVTKRFPMDGSRKIVAVEEVGKNVIQVDNRTTLETIPLWRFVEEGIDENRKVLGYWEKVNNLSQARIDAKMLDIQKDLSWEELRELSSLPEGYLTHSKIE